MIKRNTFGSIGFKALSISVIVLFAGLGILGGRATSASAGQTYNNVQVFVTPQNSTLDTFSISAYNSTGGLVASSQSAYPAFSFELPSGTYLFAVTASSSNGYPTPGPIMYGATSQGAAGSSIAYPSKYYNPEEYGYVVTNITASRTIDISTKQIQNMSTATITIKANFANGTAAVGTYVDATIVGGGYWYSPNSMMSGQTGNDGTVTLQVPAVPLQITAWNWVRVNLPTNQTTTQVNVGGEPVNVTVYWQPTYVGLAGGALLIPPTTSTTITLKAQQPTYWYYPSGVASGVATPGVASGAAQSSGAVANGPGAVPSSVAGSSPQFGSATAQNPSVVTQISPLPASTVTNVVTTTASTTVTSTSSTSNLALEGGVVAALIIAAAGIALAVRKK
jgi:hypothetical protein